MGKRARNRVQAETGVRQTKAAQRPAELPRFPSKANLDPVRKTLTAYLIGALVLAVLTLLGILVLGGTLGPFITLAVVVLGAGFLYRASSARLAGQALGGEDRMIQTMAGGMLVICVVLAAAGAVVSTVA